MAFSIGPEGKGIETRRVAAHSYERRQFSTGPEGKGIETDLRPTQYLVSDSGFSTGPEGKGIETAGIVDHFDYSSRFSIGPEGKGIETTGSHDPVPRRGSSALALKEKGLRPDENRLESATQSMFSIGPEGKGIETRRFAAA